MPLEIERKFLVCGGFKELSFKSYRIIQGYLSTESGRTVRVRLRDGQGFLTIKGALNQGGFSRFQWEKEITAEEAGDLLNLCAGRVIDKTRFLVKGPDGHVFEVDEFHGDNEGLVIAEIELKSEEEDFIRPDWLGEEVTGDRRYYNSMLLNNPYINWN